MNDNPELKKVIVEEELEFDRHLYRRCNFCDTHRTDSIEML